MPLSSWSSRTRMVALLCTLVLVVPAAAAPGLASRPDPTVKRELIFEKTRFVVDVGLAVGALRQWVYKPFRAGAFASGANGRTKAFVKAGLAPRSPRTGSPPPTS